MVYLKPIYSISYRNNPIYPILPILYPTRLDLSYPIYQPGGVSYGLDNRRAEYELVLKPLGRYQAERSISGVPQVGVYHKPICSTSPFL